MELRIERFDLAVFDFEMPEMNGFELARRWWRNWDWHPGDENHLVEFVRGHSKRTVCRSRRPSLSMPS